MLLMLNKMLQTPQLSLFHHKYAAVEPSTIASVVAHSIKSGLFCKPGSSCNYIESVLFNTLVHTLPLKDSELHLRQSIPFDIYSDLLAV